MRSDTWNLITGRVTHFAYFDQLLERPAWKGKTILDFGGNTGAFLVGASDAIDHEDYWCLDVNKTVLEIGQLEYPRANFVHFNRYSPQYNPAGIRNLPIPMFDTEFDFILAFSVFTHIHPNEMLELVEQMRGMLAPHGVLAFTFTDPSYDRSLSDPTLPSGTGVRHMLERELIENPALEIDELVERARQSKWCVLIDDQLYIEPGDEFTNQRRQGRPNESYCAYFTPAFIQSLFPEGQVHAPVSPEWQHCCILRSKAIC